MSYGYNENLSVDENQARALFEIADAIRSLLYGLKYSSREGMSIAEAIEVSGTNVADAVTALAGAVEDKS